MDFAPIHSGCPLVEKKSCVFCADAAKGTSARLHRAIPYSKYPLFFRVSCRPSTKKGGIYHGKPIGYPKNTRCTRWSSGGVSRVFLFKTQYLVWANSSDLGQNLALQASEGYGGLARFFQVDEVVCNEQPYGFVSK